MLIESVDQEPNLYKVTAALPQTLVDKILSTPWLDLPWQRQPGQEQQARRLINDMALPWLLEWDLACHAMWGQIKSTVNIESTEYDHTTWWLDEPGFISALHSDHEVTAVMQLYWIGARIDLGTTFYWYNDYASKRYQFPMTVNTGYAMINRPNKNGTVNMLWNGMLEPVPRNTFRLISHSWYRAI